MFAFIACSLLTFAAPPEDWNKWVKTQTEDLQPEFARGTARDLFIVGDGKEVSLVRGKEGVRFETGAVTPNLLRLRFDAKKGAVKLFVKDTLRDLKLGSNRLKIFTLGQGVAIDGFRRQTAPEFVAFAFDSRQAGLAELRKFETFPYAEAFRVDAVFTRTEAKDVQIPATRGEPKKWKEIGTLAFKLADAAQRLTVYMDDAKATELFLMFKDGSNGKTTYGGGRFLEAKIPKSVADLKTDDHVTLDFNFAYNPMCARSAAFLCPVAQDRLGVTVDAGEKRVGAH